MFNLPDTKTLYNRLKASAKKRKIPFDLKLTDLHTLGYYLNCPVLGIPLDYSGKQLNDNSPTVDRIDSSKGHDVGNVRWVHKDINKMMSNYGDVKFIDYCTRCVNLFHSKIERPSWDEYFLTIAFTIARRSEDPNIQHGAVLVNSQNQIIGTGYNGPIKGSINELIPMNIRDEKRKWMIHAEENCILNATQSSSERGEGCKLYVTGLPCNNCLQRIINFGIKKIIMADRTGSITENTESKDMRNKILAMSKIDISIIPIDNIHLQKYCLGVL